MHARMINKKNFYEKHAPQARFFVEKNALQAKTHQTKCAAGRTDFDIFLFKLESKYSL